MIQHSKLFEEKVLDICNTSNNNYFNLEAVITSNENDDIFIEPVIIDKLEIKQLFYLNTLDDIRLYMKLLPSDMITILNNNRSLQIKLKFLSVNEDVDSIVNSEDIIEKDYTVFIPDLQDILKKYNINQLINTNENEIVLEQYVGTTIPITIMLLELKSLAFRKAFINTIFTNTSIKNAILFISKQLSFNTINYVDNFSPVIYQNLTLHPKFGKFDSIYNYIHEKYGIYDNGFTYYYNDKVLYFYPPFDVDLKRPNEKLLHIYKVQQGGYLGMTNYYKYQDGDIYIVSNSNLQNNYSSKVNIENLGSNRVFIDANKNFNDSITIETDIKVNENIINLYNESENTIEKSGISLDYINPTINLSYQRSVMKERCTDTYLLSWGFARPFVFIPGNKTILYWEENGFVEEKKCLLESVGYIFTRTNKTDKKLYVCHANLLLRTDG